MVTPPLRAEQFYKDIEKKKREVFRQWLGLSKLLSYCSKIQDRLSHEMAAGDAFDMSRTRSRSSDSDVSDWALTLSPNHCDPNVKKASLVKMDGKNNRLSSCFT
jgi:hypothetical protein